MTGHIYIIVVNVLKKKSKLVLLESSVHRDNILSPPGFITNADLDNDGLYGYYTNQHWGIYTDPNKRIIMDILYIDIEPYYDCARDQLVVSHNIFI